MTLTDRQKDVSIMYWQPKMLKTLRGCCFVVAPRNAALNQSVKLLYS